MFDVFFCGSTQYSSQQSLLAIIRQFRGCLNRKVFYPGELAKNGEWSYGWESKGSLSPKILHRYHMWTRWRINSVTGYSWFGLMARVEHVFRLRKTRVLALMRTSWNVKTHVRTRNPAYA